MSFPWWMWLVVVALPVALMSGLHWTLLDLLLDRVGTQRGERWRDRESESPETAAMPEG